MIKLGEYYISRRKVVSIIIEIGDHTVTLKRADNPKYNYPKAIHKIDFKGYYKKYKPTKNEMSLWEQKAAENG